MVDTLIFDITGDWAHFRKFYTTTSPLTFLFPPRTAIMGLLGAIIGCSKEHYARYFHTHNCKIAVQIMKSVKKDVIKENWRAGIGPGKEMDEISQIPLEVIKNPHYRISVQHQNEDIFTKLILNLKNNKFYYTPYLGISEFICELKFINSIKGEWIQDSSNTPVEIQSLIPKSAIQRSEIEYEKEYFETTIPNDVSDERTFKYLKILFERTGKPIKVVLNRPYFRIFDYNLNLLFLE